MLFAAIAGTLFLGTPPGAEAQTFPAEIDLADIDGSTGIVFNGELPLDRSGISVGGHGDINNDGISDILIGANGADWQDPSFGAEDTGKVYLVYGGQDDIASPFELSTIDGSNGVLFPGSGEDQAYGSAVSVIGDFNGDGIDDLAAVATQSSSYVFGFFGSESLPSPARQFFGFRFGTASEGGAGWRLSGGGDVNGDGIGDLIVGAPDAVVEGVASVGQSYVVFGEPRNPDDLDTILASDLDGTNGFIINGTNTGDFLGSSVDFVGDVNGDGIEDLIVGADEAELGNDITDSEGLSYVIYGRSDAFPNPLEATSVDGSNGFVMAGESQLDLFGNAVSRAGDINGDGIGDLIVGAPWADPAGNNAAGKSYVIYGLTGDLPHPFDLSSLDGCNGFELNGAAAGDQAGSSISTAGDINGDGIDDLIIGARRADPSGNDRAGRTYVVFGRAGGLPHPFDLSSVDGTNGFKINGEGPNDFSARSVSAAGDFNADGVDDLIVGAVGADPNGNDSAGRSYVVFGQRDPDASLGPVLFTDRERFMAATDATAASAPYTSVSQPPEPFASGDILFDAVAPSSLLFAEWPADFPGDNDIELALNGKEDLDILIAEGSAYALGIDFDDASGGSTPSTFRVRLMAGSEQLGCYQFGTERAAGQDYIGVWSPEPFDRLEIRETATANENEFFGTVSISQTPFTGLLFADRFESQD